jgi:hypothetical protein
MFSCHKAGLGLATLVLLALSAARPAAAQSLTFTVSATNSQAASNPFSFSFFTPTSTLAPGGTLVLTVSGTLTDTAGNGASVTPLPGGTVLFTGGGDGLTLLSTGPALSTAAGAPAIYPYPTSTSSFVTTTPLTSLNVNLGFNLSAGDSASFAGSIRYVPAATATVPEPSQTATLGLGLLGLSGLMLNARKRTAKRKASAAV